LLLAQVERYHGQPESRRQASARAAQGQQQEEQRQEEQRQEEQQQEEQQQQQEEPQPQERLLRLHPPRLVQKGLVKIVQNFESLLHHHLL
jgi:TATA-binding protein-associated factor Taf7